MKATLILVFSLLFCPAVLAQINELPLDWECSSNNIGNNTYEIIFKGKIRNEKASIIVASEGSCQFNCSISSNQNFLLLKKPFVKSKATKIDEFGDTVFQKEIIIACTLKVKEENRASQLVFDMATCLTWENNGHPIEATDKHLFRVYAQGREQKILVVGFGGWRQSILFLEN